MSEPLLHEASNDLHDYENSSFQRPYPLPLAHLYEDYRPGKLHLVPCSADLFFELPHADEDRYELVDGLLVQRSKAPPTHAHANASDVNAQHIRNALVERGETHKFGVLREASANTTEAGSSSSHAATIRIADICVYNVAVNAIRKDLSPASRKTTNPRGHPAHMKIEFTSPSTGNVNFVDKAREYAGIGVETYIINDLDKFTNTGVAETTVFTLRENKKKGKYYSSKKFRGDELVDCEFYRDRKLTPNRICDPPEAECRAELVALSPIKRAEAKAKSAEAKAEEDRRKKEAAEAKWWPTHQG